MKAESNTVTSAKSSQLEGDELAKYALKVVKWMRDWFVKTQGKYPI